MGLVMERRAPVGGRADHEDEVLRLDLHTNPDPLRVSPSTGDPVLGDLVLIGTPRRIVECSAITVTVPIGPDPADLAADFAALEPRSNLPGWTASADQTTGRVTFTPGSGPVTLNPRIGVSVQLMGLTMNREPGIARLGVSVTWREPGGTTWREQASVHEVGVFPLGFHLRDFVSDRYSVSRGESVTLTWDASQGAAVTLLYDGRVHPVTGLNSVTVEPAQSTYFHLRATAQQGAGTMERTLSMHVSVRDPDLRVGRVTVHGTLYADAFDTVDVDAIILDRELPPMPVHARLPGDTSEEPGVLRWTKAVLPEDTPAVQPAKNGAVDMVYVPLTGTRLVYSQAVGPLKDPSHFPEGTAANLVAQGNTPYAAFRKNDGAIAFAGRILRLWILTGALSGHSTTHAPAITAWPRYNGSRFVCAFRAPDGVLHYTVSWQDYYEWTPIRPLGDCHTSHAPTLQAHEELVHCVFRTDDGGVEHSYASEKGGPQEAAWSTAERIPDVETTHGPALTVYGDQLWCAYRGLDGRYRAVSHAPDGWSAPVVLSDRLTAFGPAMASGMSWVV